MRIYSLSLLLICLAPAAFAQSAAPEQAVAPTSYDYTFSQGSGAIPALPLEVMKSGAISYINGGIGDEELTQIKQQAASYNLHVMLSSTNGEYITNVHLRVLDEAGTALLDASEAGPFLYATLPAGKYTLETTNPGEVAITTPFTITSKNGFTKHIVYKQ